MFAPIDFDHAEEVRNIFKFPKPASFFLLSSACL